MEKKHLLNKYNYIAGAIGGFIIVAILIAAYFGIGSLFFDSQLAFVPKQIISENTIFIDDSGNFESNLIDMQRNLIDTLHKSNIILTPKEYTSNVVDYYNIAFLVMSAMLVVFSLLSFVHFKSSIKESFQDLLDSEVFQKNVADTLAGRAEEYLGERFEDNDEKLKIIEASYEKRFKELSKKIKELQKQVSDLENNDTEVVINGGK